MTDNPRMDELMSEVFDRVNGAIRSWIDELQEKYQQGEITYNDCLVAGGLLSVFMIHHAGEFARLVQNDHPTFAQAIFKEMARVATEDTPRTLN